MGTFDELAIKENHEIEHMLNSISERIRTARRNKQDTQRLEEDLCYVQREYEIRVARAKFAAQRNAATHE